MSMADDRRMTKRDAIEPFSNCAYMLICRIPAKRPHDAITTRRKKLHALPRRSAAANAGRGRRLPWASAGLGVARWSKADRANLPLPKFPRVFRLRGAHGRACRGRVTSSRDRVWLG